MYSINWSKLVRRDVPSPTRQPVFLSFLLALIAPIVSVYNSFTLFRQKVDEDLGMTGQVCRLRSGLNLRFDPDLGRILVLDANAIEATYIFLESENRPLYLPAFISGIAVDFVVKVPLALAPYEAIIRAFIDRYKLVTTRYRIEYI